MSSPYLRKNIWYSNYSFAGQRVRKPLSPNRRDAQAMQDEIVSANRYRENGLVPRHLSWPLFKDQYLKVQKSEKSPGTYAHDRLAFNRLEEVYNVRHVSQVTPELLEECKMRWKKKGYGECAIGSYVMRLKVAMKKAEAWRYTVPQPWRIVKNHMSPGRLIYYSIEEFAQCLKKTAGHWTTALMLMGRAGLRTGEVINLEWSDIDFETELIHIRAKSFWKPKGWTSRKPCERFIDMPEDLLSHLKSLPKKQGLLVIGKVSASQYARYFKNLVDSLRLKGSAHAFRHSYATWLISNGCSLEEVGELLGHTNPITTKMYAHLMPYARKRAVSRLPPLVPVL